MAHRFANSALNNDERFEAVSFWKNKHEIPVLKGNLGFLECQIINLLEGGDHTIYLAKVQDMGFSDIKRPLLYYKSKFMTF